MEGLLYPSEAESLDEVVAMITYLECTKTRPIEVEGVAKVLTVVTIVETLILTSRP